jgi:hypothetical protein
MQTLQLTNENKQSMTLANQKPIHEVAENPRYTVEFAQVQS